MNYSWSEKQRRMEEDIVGEIHALTPQGTNSTMFTWCCGCAICDDEPYCPNCGRKIVGWDAESRGERHNIRWKHATAHWNRGKK